MRSKTIMGAPKRDVDSLLLPHGWRVSKDNSSTEECKIFRYSARDVTVAVAFSPTNKAIGVAVCDHPGVGHVGIPAERYDELVRLIGQQPAQADLKRDADGIREFYIGAIYGDTIQASKSA